MTRIWGRGTLTAAVAALALCGSMAWGMAETGTAGAAGGASGIDPSYGEGGIVRLGTELPAGLHPQSEGESGSAVAAPNGAVFFAEEVDTCEHSWEAGCRELMVVMRYSSRGRLDGSFGERGFLTFPGTSELRQLAVDNRGRLLVASGSPQNGMSISIARYTTAGRLDRSFGTDGTVEVAGASGDNTNVDAITVAPHGQILVAFAESLYESITQSSRVTLVQLSAGGQLQHSFGKGGRTTFAIAGGRPPVFPTPAGGAFVLGDSCCGRHDFTPVYRVSGSGKLDTAFGARERRAQVRLLAGIKESTVESVVQRPGGEVELLGGGEKFGPSGGFALRLRADGDPDTGFGTKGIAEIGAHVVSAAAGRNGSTFALSEDIPENGEPAQAYAERVLNDGSLDPSFGGAAGLPLPLTGRGAQIIAAANGQATVFVEGRNFCPGVGTPCPSDPYLTRLIEPSGSKLGHGQGGNR